MNNIENIEKLTQKLLQETPEYVHSVGYGFKEVDGKLTNELSIVFGVTEKKPLSSIPQNEILPSTITSEDGSIFTTDVIQTPQAVAYPSCYTISNSVEPVSLHRSSRTTYIGGTRISIDNPLDLGNTVFTGTMGLICKDLTDNTLVALTNAHVAAYTERVASLLSSSFSNRQTTVYQASPGTNPSTMKLKRYVPLLTDGNTIDAAVVAITNSSRVNTLTSFKQLNLNYGNLEFATTSEIDNLVINKNPIFKSGATTGPVGWPGSIPWGSQSCSLTATQVGVSLGVNFNGTVLNFTSCLTYRGTFTVASSGGDSGSAVCALINPESQSLSAWKVIGLTFAGSDLGDNSPSYACRIDNICSTLQLTAWDGQTTALTNLGNERVKYVEGKSSEPFVIENGKKYWQTGLTVI
jgi:hypothetical protein